VLEPRQPDYSSGHWIAIDAAPDRCFDCLRRVDLGESPVMRALLAARGLRQLTTLDAALEMGFVVMAEEPPRSLALAMVGKPWHPRGHLQRIDATEAVAFGEPGFVKVLWRFDIEPRASGSTVATATEVWATDGAARRRFGRYWQVVAPFSGMLRRSMLRSVKRCAEG
jgi:hypothetical protein